MFANHLDALISTVNDLEKRREEASGELRNLAAERQHIERLLTLTRKQAETVRDEYRRVAKPSTLLGIVSVVLAIIGLGFAVFLYYLQIR